MSEVRPACSQVQEQVSSFVLANWARILGRTPYSSVTMFRITGLCLSHGHVSLDGGLWQVYSRMKHMEARQACTYIYKSCPAEDKVRRDNTCIAAVATGAHVPSAEATQRQCCSIIEVSVQAQRHQS